MSSIKLTGNFLATARCLIFSDGGGVSWNFNQNTNTLTASATSGGTFLSSVGLSDSSTAPIYTVGNSPLTANGTLTFTLKTQNANTVLAGPATGAAAQPAFRGLVSLDIPNNAANTTGNAATATLATTATNLAAGLANNIPYQTGAGATSFFSASNYGVQTYGATGVPTSIAGAGGVLQGSASAIPAFTTTPTLTGTNFTGIPNVALTNSSLTVTAAGSLTGGGLVSLGGSVTLTGPAAANPSGSVGLSAVNGSAGTWARSDSAPALSQTIAPTMTGNWTFNPTSGTGVAFTASAATQLVGWSLGQTGQTNWLCYQPASSSDLRYNDSGGNDILILHAGAQAANEVLATPNGSAGAIRLRTLNLPADIGTTASPLSSTATRALTGLANFKSTLSTAASAVLTADAALTVTCNETGWYDVEAFLVFFEATAGTGGFQFDFNGGGGTIANPSFVVNGFSTAAFSNAAITSISTATGIGTVNTSSTAPSWARVKGTIQVTVAGTFGIRWAQNTLLALDPTTLTAGSSITLTKIG